MPVPASGPLSAPIQAGRNLSGRYRLLEPIARGGMAEVWEGLDEVLSRPVAIKVLQAHLAEDGVFLERFRREAVTAARLVHASIVATFDTGVDDGTAYIVMELVRGPTLRQMLNEKGRFEPWLAVAVARQIADALAHAHQAGLVHRDIKPANVLLTDDEWGGLRVKITDFGIAKAGTGIGGDLTRTGIVLGTPKYLSPEQIRGAEPDGRADLYSLGVVLFEMLTGEAPFVGPTDMATALAHLNERARRVSHLVPSVPASLDRLVSDLLAKDPDRRVPSASAARQRLDALGLGPPGEGTNGHRRASRRNREGTIIPLWPRAFGPAGSPTGRSVTKTAGGSGGTPSGPPSTHVLRPGQVPPSPGRTGPGGSNVPNAPGGPVYGPGAPNYGGAPPPWEAAPTAIEAAARRSGPLPTTVLPPKPGSPPNGVDGRSGRVASVGPNGPGRPAGGSDAETSAIGQVPPAAKRHRRVRGPSLVVFSLVAIGVVVAAVLLARPGKHGSDPTGSTGGGGSVKITAVTPFMLDGHAPDDPGGLALTFDGNGTSYWHTDDYYNAHFGNLYSGMGLDIEVSKATGLHQLTVTSPSDGWSAQTYVSSGPVSPSSGVAGWGTATDSQSSINGSATFNLGGHKGQWVLLWLTNLSPNPNLPGYYQIRISQLAVS